MFKHLIKIFILAWGLCCFSSAFATTCVTSAKFTQGDGGPQVTNLNLTTSSGTITNLGLEINFDTFGGLQLQSANPLAGDFCSLTYGQPEAMFQNGSVSAGTNFWKVTYYTPTRKVFNSAACASKVYDFFTQSPHPFAFHWVENLTNISAQTDAAVFYYTSSYGANTPPCNNSKLYIPLKIEYAIGSSNSLEVAATSLFNIVGGCCGNGDYSKTSYSKTGTNLTIRTIAGSCSLTAPPINLGTFAPSVQRTQGILGGVLKSTTVTLNCPKVYNGFDVTPKVTITDAYQPSNTTCNPVNWATNGSDAIINLFTTATIGHTPAQRYCVYPVLTNGNQFSNTMTFPVIDSPTYQKSMDIYAGLFRQQVAPNPTSGPVASTLTLTVTYN